ncbi:MAG: flagellar M-ring protein FliF [Desulfocapsa sp.]|nr:flagellar M-ring protein FliF [Desulfocapsa sp.]
MAEEEINKEEQKEEVQIPERKDIWKLIKDWPLAKKLSLVAVTILSLVVFTVIILQGRTADFQLLYANLEQKDAAAVVSWLKGEKIDYQLKNNGKNIWIAANKLYETRLELSASNLPSGGGVGFEVFDKQSFALTDFVQKVNYTRALQGELARTITSLKPVEATRVHLALPEKRLFKNQQKDAKASIILTLSKDSALSNDQVQGIIHLVSGSVEGLKSENISVIDSFGKILEGTAKPDDEERFSVEMMVFQQSLERRMEKRAQDLLDKTMGYGQAMVRITANLDFAKVEKTEELFDGEEPVIRSEQVSNENNGSSGAGGIPGVESNLQGNAGGLAGGGSPSNKSTRTTNFEISKTISKTINPTGTIKSLSVSVLLADKVIPPKDEESEPTSETRNEKELKAIEAMISSALGLDVKRGDNINVASMPFMIAAEDNMFAEELPKNLLYEYLPLLKIGILSLGALLFYFILLRPIIKTMRTEVFDHNKSVSDLERAIQDTKDTKERLEQEAKDEESIEVVLDDVTSLRNDVMRNHVPTAYIIKNWINEG